MRTSLSVTLLAVALCSLAGCASSGSKSEAECKPADPNAKPVANIVNTACPVMPQDAIDPTVTVAYKGQTVGFCCHDCIEKWEKMPDSKRDALLAQVAKK